MKLAKILKLIIILIPLLLLFVHSASAQTPISYGQTLSGAISVAGEKDEFTFSGNNGDVVTLRFAKTSGTFTPCVELFSPAGSRLTYSILGVLNATLTSTGTFKLTIRDFSNTNTGNYNLSLQRVNNPAGAISLNFGQTVSATVDVFTKIVAYKFSASTNDTITIRFAKLTQTSGYFEPYLELYDATGKCIATALNDIITKQVTTTGAFYLLVTDFSRDGTGTYEFSLQRTNNPANLKDITYGSLITDFLNMITGMNVYRFTANANDKITICSSVKSETSAHLSCYLELYNTAGSRLTYGYESLKYTFTSAGTFYLFISDSFTDGTGAYKFMLRSGDISCSSIDFADPQVSLAKPQTGEIIESGSSYAITWTSSDNVGIISQEIRLSTDSGATYPTLIASGLDSSIQLYNWSVPGSLSTAKARIKIICRDAQGNIGYGETKGDIIIIKTALPGEAKDITYIYDKLNRLDKSTALIVPSSDYAYDSLGNRLNLLVSGGTNNPPQVGAVTPSSGTSTVNQAAIFTTTYLDPNGWQDIKEADFLLNTSTSTANCFYAYYDCSENKLYLRDDTNTFWLGGFIPGSANTIENSYAKLDCLQTTASGSGNTLTVKWSVTFKYAACGAKNIYLYVKDNCDAFQGWVQKGTLTIKSNDATVPTGSIQINNGAAYANSASVTLNLSATDTLSGMGAGAQMRFSNDNYTWSTPEAYATTKTWTLTSSNGTKTAYVKFKDVAGNWSTAYSDTIILDATAPTTTATGTSDLWKNTNVTVTLSATDSGLGVDKTYYSTDGTNPTTVYTTALTFTNQGLYTIKYYSRDKAGNSEIVKTANVKIDKTLPTGTIKINNNSPYTKSTLVTLNLTATDALSGMGSGAQVRFSNDNVNWSTPQNYALTASWNLTSGNGTKTVYVKFKDVAGNWSAAYSDTIILDTTAPTGTIKINNGDTYTNSTSVTLNLLATDALSGMGTGAQMQFSNNYYTWSTPEVYAISKSWILISGSGTKTVYVKFKDAVGNWSFTYSDTIILK